MALEVILQEGGDEVVAVIVSFVFTKSYRHGYFDAGFDQIIGKQLSILQELIFFPL